MFDGDFAVVDRLLLPQGGDVVLVDVAGERSIQVWRADAHWQIMSFANATYQPFKVSLSTRSSRFGTIVIDEISLITGRLFAAASRKQLGLRALRKQ